MSLLNITTGKRIYRRSRHKVVISVCKATMGNQMHIIVIEDGGERCMKDLATKSIKSIIQGAK